VSLESVSEPDDMDMDDNDEETQDNGADEPSFDTRDSTRSSSTSPDASVNGGVRRSDLEEDPMCLDMSVYAAHASTSVIMQGCGVAVES
jgi:hypothetical protein